STTGLAGDTGEVGIGEPSIAPCTIQPACEIHKLSWASTSALSPPRFLDGSSAGGRWRRPFRKAASLSVSRCSGKLLGSIQELFVNSVRIALRVKPFDEPAGRQVSRRAGRVGATSETSGRTIEDADAMRQRHVDIG